MSIRDDFHSNKEAGFTMVEIILVITIFSILLSIAVPKFINLMNQTVDSNRCAHARGAINSALAVTYCTILVNDPTQVDWLENATMNTLHDSMFATHAIPVCPTDGLFTIVHGEAFCSIHH